MADDSMVPVVMAESSEIPHPSEMDSEEDLPDSVKQALPEGGEQLFFKALQDAMDEYPDEPEGEWWSRAWDRVNDEYDKDYDDAGSNWERKEEARPVGGAASLDERRRRFLREG